MPTAELTYEHPRLRLNHEKRECRGCGEVHTYWTKGCVPVLVPDSWQDDGYCEPGDLTPVPEGVETVEMA